MQKLAIKNLTRLGLADRVTFKLRDIQGGFDESGVDAIFLDVQNAYDFLSQVRSSLKSGGFFGSIMPTTNQVQRLLIALYQTTLPLQMYAKLSFDTISLSLNDYAPRTEW